MSVLVVLACSESSDKPVQTYQSLHCSYTQSSFHGTGAMSIPNYGWTLFPHNNLICVEPVWNLVKGICKIFFSTFQGRSNFQGHFKKAFQIQVIFFLVRTLGTKALIFGYGHHLPPYFVCVSKEGSAAGLSEPLPSLVTYAWVKVQTFQNPELLKFKFQNLGDAYTNE